MPLVIEILKKGTKERLVKAGLISAQDMETLLRASHKRIKKELFSNDYKKIMEEPPSSIYKVVRGRRRLENR